jgi:hypothetical protein
MKWTLLDDRHSQGCVTGIWKLTFYPRKKKTKGEEKKFYHQNIAPLLEGGAATKILVAGLAI